MSDIIPIRRRSTRTLRIFTYLCHRLLLLLQPLHPSPQGKADAFMTAYAAVNRLNFSRTERSRIRQLKEVLRSPTVDEACCQPFQPSRLDRAIRQIRTKGAPGPGDIPPSFRKAPGPRAKTNLVEIFICSVATMTSTHIWKRAVILPLKKAGKQPEAIAYYRPVSPTSCVAKTTKRMIHNRLYYIAETRGWLFSKQADFRTSRSCEGKILRVTQTTSDGY